MSEGPVLRPPATSTTSATSPLVLRRRDVTAPLWRISFSYTGNQDDNGSGKDDDYSDDDLDDW